MKNFVLIALLLTAAACSDSNGSGGTGGTGGAGGTGGSGGTGGTGGTGGSGDRTTPPEDLKANPSPTTTDVGAPLDEAEVQTIGTTGGTLRFFTAGWRKGPTLVFPAGAVAEDTEISVAPIVSMAPHSIGDTWRFGPDGAVFSKSVEVRFPLPASSRSPGSTAGVGVAFQNAEGYWQAVVDVHVDEEANEVVASVDHFSDWTAFQMLELRPATPSVEVGDSIGLWVYKCTTTTAPPSGDDPILVIPTCNAVAGELSGWKVNGVPGGSGSDGSVMPVMYGAIYTAPDEVPARNPVAVTVDVPLPNGAKGMLVSNVDVYDEQPCSPDSPCEWIGTTSWQTYGLLDSGEVGLMIEEHANIHWKVQEVTWDGRQIGYDPYGTAVRVDNVNDCYTPDALIIESPTRYETVGVEKLSELRIDFSDPAAPTAWIVAFHGYYADGEICGDELYEAGFAVSSCDLDYNEDLGTISCSTETFDEDTGLREVRSAFFTRVKVQPE